MRKLNIGICDDERLFHYLLESAVREYLAKKERDFNIQIFETGEELLAKAEELDIVFLDVVLPKLDGFQVGKMLRRINHDCKIIIASSHVERFHEAFKIHALRFIRKPFKYNEIEEALEAAQAIEIGTEKIQLYENRRLFEVEQKLIHYVVAYDSYTEFVLRNRILRKDISLRELEKIMDSRLFFRIDRKLMVNMLFVQNYKKGVIIMDQLEIGVSRRRKKEFEQAYGEFDLRYREGS